MNQFLVRGHLQCVLLFGVMATLGVLFSNIRGYHQGLPELSVCLMSVRPDFVALVETHLAGESLQMHLPTGYVLALLVIFMLCVRTV